MMDPEMRPHDGGVVGLGRDDVTFSLVVLLRDAHARPALVPVALDLLECFVDSTTIVTHRTDS